MQLNITDIHQSYTLTRVRADGKTFEIPVTIGAPALITPDMTDPELAGMAGHYYAPVRIQGLQGVNEYFIALGATEDQALSFAQSLPADFIRIHPIYCDEIDVSHLPKNTVDLPPDNNPPAPPGPVPSAG